MNMDITSLNSSLGFTHIHLAFAAITTDFKVYSSRADHQMFRNGRPTDPGEKPLAGH